MVSCLFVRNHVPNIQSEYANKTVPGKDVSSGESCVTAYTRKGNDRWIGKVDKIRPRTQPDKQYNSGSMAAAEERFNPHGRVEVIAWRPRSTRNDCESLLQEA